MSVVQNFKPIKYYAMQVLKQAFPGVMVAEDVARVVSLPEVSQLFSKNSLRRQKI
jgi:hypothetical protein